MALIARSEERVNALRSAQEKHFYAVTAASLKANQHGQFALATLVTFVLSLGIVGITVVLRRSRSDVERAYAALKGEVGERRVAEGWRCGRARVGFRSLVQRASDLTIVTDDAGSSRTSAPPSRRWSATGRTTSWSCRCSCTSSRRSGRRRHGHHAAHRAAGLVRTIELRLRTHDGRTRSVEGRLPEPARRPRRPRPRLERARRHRAQGAGERAQPPRPPRPADRPAQPGAAAAAAGRRADLAEVGARRLSMVVIDLDGFKNVNDTWATSRATSCCRRPRGGCSTACGRATSQRGWVATSSPS
jgi:hypothetical protein